jgi:hypothetical protein
LTWADDCVTPSTAGALFGGGLSAEAALDAEVEQGRAAIEASKRAGVNFIVASTMNECIHLVRVGIGLANNAFRHKTAVGDDTVNAVGVKHLTLHAHVHTRG